MLKIGITGGIGSGKSLVAKIFNTLNIPVFDADAASKNILNEDENLQQKIIQYFGNVYHNRTLNRKLLAEIVFADKEKLQLLNSLVHPATIAYWENWAQKQNAPYIIKEAAILFESGTAGDLDFVIGIFAPKPMRILRTMQRNNINREEVLKRMNNQLDENIKMKLCDFVILNDEKKLLIPQVMEVHRTLLNTKKENKKLNQ